MPAPPANRARSRLVQPCGMLIDGCRLAKNRAPTTEIPRRRGKRFCASRRRFRATFRSTGGRWNRRGGNDRPVSAKAAISDLVNQRAVSSS